MNKIKSLLRNFKARTVSFFKAPYHKFYQSLWDSIHDQTVSLVSDKLENDQDFLDLEEKVNDMNDSKLNTDDFDYELCNNYTFTELEEKVDELEEQLHRLIIEVKRKVDEPTDPNIHYLVSELQKAVQDEADISVFAYLVESLYNKVADDG